MRIACRAALVPSLPAQIMTVDPPKNRIIAAGEEILHQSRKGGKVLWRSEDITVGCEHIVRSRGNGLAQTHINAGLHCSTHCRRLRHLARSARQGMIDNQQRFHPGNSPDAAGMAYSAYCTFKYSH